jgi:Flp pilus assembly protein TadG
MSRLRRDRRVLIRLSQLLKGSRSQEGAAELEFAVILPILVLLTLGSLDLGHRYYMQYLLTNASREGARYAAKYTGIDSVPTSAAVSDYVKSPPPGLNYDAYNFDALTVTTTYSGSFPNQIATVTVTAVKHWWILGAFRFLGFPGLTNPQTITATTAMNVEH